MDAAAPLRRVALLLAGSAGLSRLLGFARDQLLNATFGVGPATDAYRASFILPDMLNYLLAGGALTVSFLPQMAALYARLDREAGAPVGRHPEVDRALGQVGSFLVAAALLLVLLGEVFAEALVARWVHGLDADGVAQTARLTRIILPAQVFFLAGGLIQATLLARQRFAAMALTPLLYNAGILVGGGIGAASGAIDGFSWGALVGAFAGALVVPWWTARGQVRLVPAWPTLGPEVRTFLWTALPLMIGVSLTTVDEWFGIRYASDLGAGAISWLQSARRLVLVPIGLVGTAAGTATGAYVARLHAEGRHGELAQALADALAGVTALSLLCAAFAAAAPGPIVGLLYEHGKFGPSDTAATAPVLAALALGIAPWALQAVLARALYAVGDTWRPMLWTSAITLLAWPLYPLLAARYGLRGLALAGVIGMTAQVVAMVALVRRRWPLPLAPLAAQTARALAVAAVAGMAAAGAVQVLASGEGERMFFADLPQRWAASAGYATQLAAAGAAWAATALTLGVACKLPGLERVAARLRRLPVRRGEP